MNVLNLILAALTVFSIQSFAQAAPEDSEGTQALVDESISTDVVKHHEDLATHLGLSDQDALFGTPRDFRADHLNELSLEPLKPTITEKN